MRWSGRAWVAYEVGHADLRVAELSTDPDLPRLMVAEGARVLVWWRQPGKRRFTYRGLTTCVTTAKLSLGIRVLRVQTPAQLYAYMLRRGAEVVADEVPEAQALPSGHRGSS